MSLLIGVVAALSLVLSISNAVGDNSQSKKIDQIIEAVNGLQSSDLGAATPGTRFPHGITIGLPTNSPTNIADIKTGTCVLLTTDVSQPATTTLPYDCAVTGVVSGDNVIAQLSSSTPAFGGATGWSIVASKASTTAGFITVLLANNSGAPRIPSAYGVGSSTTYQIIKTQ